MINLTAIKAVGSLVVSVGVGAVVGNTVKYTTPANIGVIKKACIGVGAVVLSNMAGDAASEYIEKKIDQTINDVKKMFVKEKEEN